MPVRRGRKGKQGGKQGFGKQAAAAAAVTRSSPNNNKLVVQEEPKKAAAAPPPPPELILTSDKRRGVYECDYCGADISQTPRIRCAVCDDFDLCCDCFAATDHHVTAMARLRAAHAVTEQLHGVQSSSSSPGAPAKDHDPCKHGYRVCDSTRYPLFPARSGSAKHAVIASGAKNKNKVSTSATTSDVESSDGTEENEFDPSEEDNVDVGDDKNGGDVDAKKTEEMSVEEEDAEGAGAAGAVIMHAGDDVKTIWTVEEDLRLLQGIQTHGLGNWSDICEAVAGQGSQGKTAKRCMERYFDDFMGRYGHILPPYTLISESTVPTREESDANYDVLENYEGEAPSLGAATPGKDPEGGASRSGDAAAGYTGGEATRSSKRRSTMFRTPSSLSNNGTVSAKKYKAVPTESLPEYQEVRPIPFLPTRASGPVELGQEVGRDQATRAEQAYVRAIASMDNKEQLERIRKDWEQNRLNKPGGPTVLPMRSDDIPNLPGSELAGFMPRRGDFDVEWENSAEEAIADMEFIPGESEQDRKLKLQVLAIYNSKLDERERRKQFVLTRKLYDYRKYQQEYQKLPRDERDLVHRMRLFERFHTPAEHQLFLADLLKAKRLRKEIAKLQMYRRMGIRTLVEAERYELDKARRLFHKTAVAQKEAATAKRAEGSAGAVADVASRGATGAAPVDDGGDSYWKQYRTTDRKVRRSVNRGAFPADESKVRTASGGETAVVDNNCVTRNIAAADEVPKSDGGGAAAAAAAVAPGGTGETRTDEAATEKTCGDDAMDIDSQKEKVVSEASPDDAIDAESAEVLHVDEKEPAAAENKKEDLSHLPGFNLLSAREVDLCHSVSLKPAQYLEIKKALIYESLVQGLLDDKINAHNRNRNNVSGKFGKKLGPGAQHTLVKIDVERRGTVIDFVVRAGWISTQFGQALREGSLY